MSDEQRQAAFRNYFYRELSRLRDGAEMTDVGRAKSLKVYLLKLIDRVTEDDKLHFATNFARISYVAHKFGVAGVHVYQLRKFLRAKPEGLPPADLADLLDTGYHVATELIRTFYGGAVPPSFVGYLTAEYPSPYVAPTVKASYARMRAAVMELDAESQELYLRPETDPGRVLSLPYDEERVRNPYVRQAAQILEGLGRLPIQVNLLNAQVRRDGLLYPDHVVLEPDYLLDVTAVAESFDGDKTYQPWSGLARKLVPRKPKLPLVRGKIVNDFLDKLIEDPDVPFTAIVKDIFQTSPLELSLFQDAEVLQLMGDLKHHFASLHRFVRERMDEFDLGREGMMLEPSFLSPTYGVQGRLDMLQMATRPGEPTSIVELKTSAYWNRNKHGINASNYIQTLLYDLMINEALGEGANVRSYILYSKDFDNGMKYAPPEAAQRREALAARNQLLAVELLLQDLGVDSHADLVTQTDRVMGRLRPHRFERLSKFAAEDHQTVIGAYDQLSDLEKRYLGAFLGFTAREQRLSKTGQQGVEGRHGLASLWLDPREAKNERFELLDGLRMRHYVTETAVIELDRGADDERIVKFRQGDIVVFYATSGERVRTGEVLTGRVHKATVVDITPRRVVLRLRNPQLTEDVFAGDEYFVIEPDVLDSGFRNFYNGLFVWASGTQQFRRRWLGLDAPARSEPHPQSISAKLTEEQDDILRRIITAPDYFLLWGPPGTGKTSQMLHHLVDHLLKHTTENVLLIAYTNRAVDEICHSIERIEVDGEPFRNYLRIGSRYGAEERFQDRLLQVRAGEVRRRKELTRLIDQTRIFVGTVASLGSKQEVFLLKKFDRIVVDEASQILEPLLAGLLPRAPRALLIGDHKQLPAVLQQPDHSTKVRDEKLRGVGLTNLGNSLFERLYKTAMRKGWNWAYARLSHQGRMHEDIMAFPARNFYGGKLKILPATITHHLTQLSPLALRNGGDTDAPLSRLLASRRVVFLPTDMDGGEDPKVNGYESDLVVDLISRFEAIYAASGKGLAAGDIGVITPYRAQIARIRRSIREAGLDVDAYLVDTVERYQGGAKRIIIISLCTNAFEQINMLSRLDEDRVDRKLNVALTRAREHLVLIGCPEVLRQNEVYESLLDFIEAAGGSLPPTR